MAESLRGMAASKALGMSSGEKLSNNLFGPAPGKGGYPGTGVYAGGNQDHNHPFSERRVGGQRVNQGVQRGTPRGPRPIPPARGEISTEGGLRRTTA